jgi:hypothetical protein
VSLKTVYNRLAEYQGEESRDGARVVAFRGAR